MFSSGPVIPDRLPLLSRGKHRTPRKGACFMELASVLAGERWSDHPACTHPLLARLARCVNDATSDDARSRLAVHIPSVIGLTSDDLHVDVRIALRCARAALPATVLERQRDLAVGVLTCERMLDDLDQRPPGTLEQRSRAALDQVPEAVAWARRFIDGQRPAAGAFRRHAAPTIVSYAVESIAKGHAADADERLHDLLVAAIGDVEAIVRSEVGVTPTRR